MSPFSLALILFSLPPLAPGLDPAGQQGGGGGTQPSCTPTTEADGTYYYYRIAVMPVSGDSNCLDVYLPTTTALGMTILYIHGGGFTTGDKADSTALGYCQALADLGYHVVSANYKLAVEGQINPATASFPRAVKDLKAAVAWIRFDPHSLALPDCVIAVGNSAGAALAALIGTTGNDVAELEPAAHTTYGTEEDFHVDGVVTFAAVGDFVAGGCDGYEIPGDLDCDDNSGDCKDTSWSHPYGGCCFDPCVRVPCNAGEVKWCLDYPGDTGAESFLGVDWGSCQDHDPTIPGWSTSPFVNASAAHWVDAYDPPYYGFSAELDSLVPGNQTKLLADALTGPGQPEPGYSLKAWELGCGHGLETLFWHDCGGGSTCTWEPLSPACNSCTGPEDRAARQTKSAIDLLEVTCE